MVLYDADKLIDFNVSNQKISYYTNVIKIDKLYERVKKSYFGSKQYRQKKAIQKLIYNGNVDYKSDTKNIKYIGNDLSSHVCSINDNILLPNNYMLLPTTVEGSLININNIHLFNKWLVSEVINNFCVNDHNDVSKFIKACKDMYKRGRDVEEVFKLLLSLDGVEKKTTKEQDVFIKKIKYKYLNKVKKELKRRCNNLDDLLIIYRLVFNGKTDTLISLSNKSYTTSIDSSFRDVVTDTNDKYLSPLGPLMSKTGGWVTRFLDYSIKHIRKDFRENEFEKEFEFLFPEIHGIIKFASSSIE